MHNAQVPIKIIDLHCKRGYDEAAWVEKENMLLHRMANMLQATAESHASRSSRDALISAAEEVVRLAKKEK